MSRRHFKLRVDGQHVFISDLNSTNKTRLANKILEPGVEYPLKDQDQIQVGDQFFVFICREVKSTSQITQTKIEAVNSFTSAAVFSEVTPPSGLLSDLKAFFTFKGWDTTTFVCVLLCLLWVVASGSEMKEQGAFSAGLLHLPEDAFLSWAVGAGISLLTLSFIHYELAQHKVGGVMGRAFFSLLLPFIFVVGQNSDHFGFQESARQNQITLHCLEQWNQLKCARDLKASRDAMRTLPSETKNKILMAMQGTDFSSVPLAQSKKQIKSVGKGDPSRLLVSKVLSVLGILVSAFQWGYMVWKGLVPLEKNILVSMLKKMWPMGVGLQLFMIGSSSLIIPDSDVFACLLMGTGFCVFYLQGKRIQDQIARGEFYAWPKPKKVPLISRVIFSFFCFWFLYEGLEITLPDHYLRGMICLGFTCLMFHQLAKRQKKLTQSSKEAEAPPTDKRLAG